MHESDRFFTKLFSPGTLHCAIACAFIGIFTALLLLSAGIWKTLLVALLVGLGVFLGGVKDKKAFFQRIIRQLGRN